MRQLLRLYRAQCGVTLAIQLQYPVAMAIWIIGVVLEPVLYLVVWEVAVSGGAGIAGYGPGDFARYYIVLLVVNHLTYTWFFGRIEERIRMGRFSPQLLRPVHPVHKDFAEALTFKMLTALIVLPTAVLVGLSFDVSWSLRPWAVLAFVPTLLLALATRFVLEWTVALCALWTTRVDAVTRVYSFVVLFLSGFVAPLPLLPQWLRVLADWLPFRWLIAFPVETLLGQRTPASVLAGLGAQAGWLVFALVLMRVVWRAGIRRYEAVEG
jgi:viologen exporter family transport system permease protein